MRRNRQLCKLTWLAITLVLVAVPGGVPASMAGKQPAAVAALDSSRAAAPRGHLARTELDRSPPALAPPTAAAPRTESSPGLAMPLPPCPVPLTAVGISGPTTGYTDPEWPFVFTAVITPSNATEPIVYTWSPEPDDGGGTPVPAYLWDTPGIYNLTVQASNCGGSVSGNLSVRVISKQVTAQVTPAAGGELVFTDFQDKQTTVQVPVGGVAETISLVYTHLETPTEGHSFTFAGHAFTLEVYRGEELLPGFVFQKPAVLTLEYSDADIGDGDELALELRAWDGNQWSSDGIAVLERDTAGNRLVVTVAHLSEFALFVIEQPRESSLHLPLVVSGYSPPPGRQCQGLIANGGFEEDSDWVISHTPRPARFTTVRAHTDSRSMLLGLAPGESDVRSYSSVRQVVTLPANRPKVRLTFWVYRQSNLDGGDRQEWLLLDEEGDLLGILGRTNVNSAAWTQIGFNLSDYAGQKVQLYWNAYNDGDPTGARTRGQGVTGFYLDDVVLEACTTDVQIPWPKPVPPQAADCMPTLLATPAVGDAPHGVGVNSAAGRVYVGNHGADTISILDATTRAVVGTAAAGDGPNGVAYNPANNRIYVANRNSNSVTVLRASDYGLVTTIAVGSLPDGVAVNPAKNRVYVANFASGTISVIDGTSDTVVQTITVGREPSMVAVHAAADKVYVSLHGEGKVAVINAAGQSTKVNIRSSGPYGIAVDEARNLVYVTTIESARIAVIDSTQDRLLGWTEVQTSGGEPVPLRMVAVNPLIGTSGHIYVTTAGADGGRNQLLLLPRGWEERWGRPQGFDVSEPQEGIAFDPAMLQVWVPSRSQDRVAVYLDGEPVCTPGLVGTGGYQLKICVANPDGTCQAAEVR